MPIQRNFHPESDTLIIAFTGFNGRLFLNPPQFFKRAGLTECKRITINDPSRKMCLAGLDDNLPTFGSFIKKLNKMIEKSGAKKIITIGTSGGTFTSILVAHLLKADTCYAFSAYPYLSRAVMKDYNDPALETMSSLVDAYDALPDEVQQYLDLKLVLNEWNGKTQYKIHVSQDHEWDCRRSAHLVGCPNVEIIKHPYDCHAFVHNLAKEDKLKDCFMLPAS